MTTTIEEYQKISEFIERGKVGIALKNKTILRLIELYPDSSSNEAITKLLKETSN